MSRFSRIRSEAKRELAIARERARVHRIVGKFLAKKTPLELAPMTAVIVFLHESIHADLSDAETKLAESGRLILASSLQARCLILTAAISVIAHAPLEDSIWKMSGSVETYDLRDACRLLDTLNQTP